MVPGALLLPMAIPRGRRLALVAVTAKSLGLLLLEGLLEHPFG
jgi:hypothetical protein